MASHPLRDWLAHNISTAQAFAVVGPVLLQSVIPLLKTHAPRYEHLVVGQDPKGAMRPWLIRLMSAHPFSEALCQQVDWEQAVYGISSVPFVILKQHLRALNRVEFPDGQQHNLRYHDPRILSVLLKNAQAAEQAHLYGPVDAYWLEQETHLRPQDLPTADLGNYHISQQQYNALEALPWEKLIQEHSWTLAVRLAPDAQRPNVQDQRLITAQVREGMARAIGYDLESPYALKAFSALWVAGLDDDYIAQNVALQKILSQPGSQDWEKIQNLKQALQQQG